MKCYTLNPEWQFPNQCHTLILLRKLVQNYLPQPEKENILTFVIDTTKLIEIFGNTLFNNK
jgi:hypothetical protein